MEKCVHDLELLSPFYSSMISTAFKGGGVYFYAIYKCKSCKKIFRLDSECYRFIEISYNGN
jgi:hypothetical protein